MQTLDPQTELQACLEGIRDSGVFERAGMVEEWPMATIAVAKLLSDGSGYAVDADDLIDLINRGILPAPGKEDNEFDWMATDVCLAVSVLEARQQWQPFPSLHDSKKHPAQLSLEMARVDGVVEQAIANIPGQPRYDAIQLLRRLVTEQSHDQRAKIAVLLKATLETDFVVILP